MTNERAIEVLKAVLKVHIVCPELGMPKHPNEDIVEALQMAVDALDGREEIK